MDFPKAPLICSLVLFILTTCSLIIFFAYCYFKERSSFRKKFWTREFWTLPCDLTVLCTILAVVGLGFVVALLASQSDPSRFSRIFRAAIAFAVAFVVAENLADVRFTRLVLNQV